MSNKLAIGILVLLMIIADQHCNGQSHSTNQTLSMKANFFHQQLKMLRKVHEATIEESCYNVTGNRNTFKEFEAAQEKTESCILAQITGAMHDCLKSQSSPIALKDQIVDIVKAICKRKKELFECQADFFKVVKKCMQPGDQKNLTNTLEVIESLVSYVCANDAERVSSFVKNGGVECVIQNVAELTQCLTILSDRMPHNVDPTFVIQPQDNAAACKAVDTFFKCIVKKMETCGNKKPAEIVDGFFNLALSSAEECRSKPNSTKDV